MFDSGWDVYRQTVFTRQMRMGMIPANTVLPDRDPAITPWRALPPAERRLYARFMEVYAGYLAYTDHEIGRLVDHLKAMHQYDNTLFIVMIGDNGASKEGSLNGDIDRPISATLGPPLDYRQNVAYNLARLARSVPVRPPKATIRSAGRKPRIRHSACGSPIPTANVAPAIR